MQQIKIFKGLESEIAQLEEQVNQWLRESGVQVLEMTGNIAPQSPSAKSQSAGLGQGAFAPSDIVLIVRYETSVK